MTRRGFFKATISVHLRTWGLTFWSSLENQLLRASLKMPVLRGLETARQVFSSLGFVVKQDESFLFLTQFTGFPGACLETIPAKAYLPQEHFSCSGKTGQAITGRSCHHVEDTSGSSEPYGTLHLCSPSRKDVHASLCMSDSRNRPSQLFLPPVAPLVLAGPPPVPQHLPRDMVVFASFALKDNYWCFLVWTGTFPRQSKSLTDFAFRSLGFTAVPNACYKFSHCLSLPR